MKGKTALIIAAVAVIVGVCLWSFFIRNAVNQSRKPSKAAGEPLSVSFFPPGAHVMAGEDVTVHVHAKAAQSLIIRGYNVELSFDPSKVRFKNIEYYIGAISTGMGQTNNDAAVINRDGRIRLTGESNTAAGFVLSQGYETNIAAVTFTVITNETNYVRYIKNARSPKYFAMNADFSLTDLPLDIGDDFPINLPRTVSGSSSTSSTSSTASGSSVSSSSRSSSSSSISSATGSSSSSSSGQSSAAGQSSSASQAGSSSNSTNSSQSLSSSSGASSSSQSGGTSLSGSSQSAQSSASSQSSQSSSEPAGTTGENGYDVVLNMKIKLQGVVSAPLTRAAIPVKIHLGSSKQANYSQSNIIVPFTPQNDGTWTGTAKFSGIRSDVGYYLFLKGPKHLQRKVCDLNPVNGFNTIYTCGTGSLSLKEGSNTVDMSKILLMAGDLPESGAQNGVVESYDTAFIRQHIQSQKAEDLAIADLNYDGVIDSQDFSLVLTSILVKYDEE